MAGFLRMTDPVGRLRGLCLALAEVTERVRPRRTGWVVRGKRQFVTLDDHHRGVDRLAFRCAAPPGAQDELIAHGPDRFFRPPYVWHRGWVGVRIDGGPDGARSARSCRTPTGRPPRSG